jgi:tetratricopeptide (TPR) repeat protein
LPADPGEITPMDDLPRILALYESGQLAAADTACGELLSREPENAAGWALRGSIALKQTSFADAADYLQRATDLTPGDHELFVNLGMALHGAGRIAEATRAFKDALKRNPSSAICFMYLGRCYLAAGRLTDAASALNAALKLHPEWPEVLDAFAVLSLALNRPDKALTFVHRALTREPRRLASLQLGATASERTGDYAAAVAYYNDVIGTQPEIASLAGLAISLQRLGRHEDAVRAFDQALGTSPSDPTLKHGRGSSLLALGRLGEGWPLYGARFHMSTNAEAGRAAAGEPLHKPPHAGMRVAAWADQGIGEQILFANLVPDLIRTGAEIALECDYRLAPLFARSFPQITVCAHTEPANAALASFTDGRFCLSDAAPWFRNTFDAFPKHAGYLTPDPRLVAALKNKYTAGRKDKPLVGISWRRADGSVLSDTKTLPLEQWGPILHIAGITFVNLQYGDCGGELAATMDRFGVRIVSDAAIDPLMNLDAFAAQVAAMDLVISTSSTTAHMAGAVNVPTWTFLPAGMGSLWHWFLDRADSPWYPRMKLFRQSDRGDWEAVVDAASSALVDFVDAWHSAPATATGAR